MGGPLLRSEIRSAAAHGERARSDGAGARIALKGALAATLAVATMLAACGPKPPPQPPARPSLDAVPSPSGTPDPRLARLQIAKMEPDPVKRAEMLAEIAKGAPPSDRVARSARVAAIRSWALAGTLDRMQREAGELEIADDSEGADLLNVMAYAYAEQGKSLDRALQYSQRALEIVLSLTRPDAMPAETWKRQIAAVIAAYRDTLGWVLFKGGDVRGAVRELSAAAEILPDDPTVNWHLGQALLKAEKHEDAVAALVRAAVAEGEDSEAAKALAFGTAEKAKLTAADVTAKLVAARKSLEERVVAAATAKKLEEDARELQCVDEAGTAPRIQPGDGRPSLVLFWATYSDPSLRVLKRIDAIAGERARVLTVSVDRNREAARKAAADAGVPVPCIDGAGEDAASFQVRGMPTVLVLDAAGRVRYRNEGIGPGYELQLKAQLDSLGDPK